MTAGQDGWTVAANQLLDAPSPRCRVLVLHRVRHDALTERIVDLARRRGAGVVYDIDDFVTAAPGDEDFSPEIARAMALADVVSVSGTFLEERAKRIGKDVRVMRNKLSAEVLARGRRALDGPRGDRPFTIGYFSGSSHHDDDFGLIAEEVLAFLKSEPDAHLVVGGKIAVPAEFASLKERFRFEPFRPYDAFIDLLGGIDVNLAPLDLSSDFSRARSELKYLEAAAFGVPTVASPSPAYVEAMTPSQRGLICQPGEWFEALRTLSRDAALRRDLGQRARAHVEIECGPKTGSAEWGALVGDLTSSGAGEGVVGLGTVSRAIAVSGRARMRRVRHLVKARLG